MDANEDGAGMGGNLLLQRLVKIAAAIDCDLKLEIERKAGQQISRKGHAVSALRKGHCERRPVRRGSRIEEPQV